MKIKKSIIAVVIITFLVNGLPILAEETHESTTGSQAENIDKKENPDTKDTGGKKVSENEKKDDRHTSFFKSVLEDEAHILTSPLRIKGKDLLLLGGLALATGVMIANDESIYRNIKEYQAKHKWVSDVSPKITKLGLGEWNLGIAGSFYLGGLAFKDKKAKETARLIAMTFIHTSVVVQIGKHLASRQRPSWDNGNDHWDGPAGFFKRYEGGQMSHYDAFPSGHTISIFGTATVISEMYKRTVWVPILSYTLASLTGISRITEDTHWLSDVFVGAVLGYAIGKYVVKKRNRLGGEKARELSVYPVAGSHHLGIGAQYLF